MDIGAGKGVAVAPDRKAGRSHLPYLSDLTMTGALIGGTSAAFLFGPVGAIAGVVAGSSTGAAIDWLLDSSEQRQRLASDARASHPAATENSPQ